MHRNLVQNVIQVRQVALIDWRSIFLLCIRISHRYDSASHLHPSLRLLDKSKAQHFVGWNRSCTNDRALHNTQVTSVRVFQFPSTKMSFACLVLTTCLAAVLAMPPQHDPPCAPCTPVIGKIIRTIFKSTDCNSVLGHY